MSQQSSILTVYQQSGIFPSQSDPPEVASFVLASSFHGVNARGRYPAENDALFLDTWDQIRVSQPRHQLGVLLSVLASVCAFQPGNKWNQGEIRPEWIGYLMA